MGKMTRTMFARAQLGYASELLMSPLAMRTNSLMTVQDRGRRSPLLWGQGSAADRRQQTFVLRLHDGRYRIYYAVEDSHFWQHSSDRHLGTGYSITEERR